MISAKSSDTEIKQTFDEYYWRKLFPFLQEKEKTRHKYLKQFWILLAISSIVLPLLIILIWQSEALSNSDYGAEAMFMLVAVTVYILQRPYSTYRQKVKNDVMNIFIRFFPGFKYHYKRGFTDQEIKNSLIFPDYDTLTADDCFSGTYDGVDLKICEEELKKVYRTSKGQRRVDTVFQGIAIEMVMNKNFSGHTIVLKDAGIFNIFKNFKQLQRVKLEDVTFEREFEVFSSDQIEARYLLTTAFMERILKLRELYHGQSIEISFYQNKILLAIDTREDMFEPCTFFKTNLNKKNMDIVLEQMLTIFSIIRLLKLNQRIGL